MKNVEMEALHIEETKYLIWMNISNTRVAYESEKLFQIEWKKMLLKAVMKIYLNKRLKHTNNNIKITQ